MITESARQVIGRMRALLEDFDPGPDVDALGRRVASLSGALDALLGDVDDDWLEELRSAWWPLEFVYACVLDEGRQTLDEPEVAAAAAARDAFLALLVGR